MKKITKISLLCFKAFSSFCVAYVLTLIGQEFLSFGLLSFVFLILSISLSFFYFIRAYGFPGVLFINLLLVALAFGLRFYVISAYSS